MSIKRGDRMFVSLSAIGETDATGKTILSFGYKGKLIADPDKPLSMLCLGFVETIIGLARYSSPEALREDLDQFVKYVASLEERSSEFGDKNGKGDAA